MGKIYIIRDNNGEEKELVSLEYVKQIIKQIMDIITNKERYSINLSIPEERERIDLETDISDLCSTKELDNIKDNLDEYKSLLYTEIDKPSKFELESQVTYIKEENEKYLEQIFTRIINTPDVLNKLRDISLFFQENNNKDTIIDILSDKISKKDFDNHATSQFHLTNNDRAALNLLLQFVKEGIDWNVENCDNPLLYIKNKPNSLPANGGDADSINGYKIKDLLNNTENVITIGSITDSNEACSLKLFDDDESENANKFYSVINIYKNNYPVLFKTGDFEFIKELNFKGDDSRGKMIIHGCGNELTKLYINNLFISSASIKDLQICESTIIVYENSDIDNVVFKACTIIFKNSSANNITNCKFIDCNFNIVGLFSYNIVSLNRYIKSEPIKYIGGNNIIINNIEMN